MSPFTRVVVLACLAIVVYDTAMSAASRTFGFPYTSGIAGSYLIYAAAGFFGARAGGGLWMGVLAGAAVGLTDATLGWLISWVIGPGRPPDGMRTAGSLAGVIIFVTFLAATVGFVGSLVARLFGSSSAPPA
jgi:hypothetical protein